MSSSSSSSSDSENASSANVNVTSKKQKKIKGSDPNSSSSSSNNSDKDENEKESGKHKSKHLLHNSTVSNMSSKLLFQNMLMGSNNKMAELLKNKQNMAAKKENETASPAKSILKGGLKSPEVDFNPIAHSTQIRETSMTASPMVEIRKGKKSKERHSSESEDLKKQERLNRKEINKGREVQKNVNNASSSSGSSSEDSKRTSSDSEDEKRRQNLIKATSSKKHKKKVAKKDDDTNITSDSGTVCNKSSRPSKQSESLSPKSKQKSKNKTRETSESDSETDGEKTVTAPNKIAEQFKKFTSYYKNSQRIHKEENILQNVKFDKEIFLVQIPKTHDVKSLIGTSISLEQPTKVPGSGRKYECLPSYRSQKEPLPVYTNTEKVHLLKQIGNLKVQKRLKSKTVPDLSGVWQEEAVPFPENVKQRHPLFGADFSDKINLEEHIQEKLKAAVESYTKQKKKKKKHKKRESEGTDEVQPQEEIFKFLGEPDSLVKSGGLEEKKKKKKHKYSYDELDSSHRESTAAEDNSEATSQLINEMLLSRSMEMSEPKKKKKKRKHSESTSIEMTVKRRNKNEQKC